MEAWQVSPNFETARNEKHQIERKGKHRSAEYNQHGPQVDSSARFWKNGCGATLSRGIPHSSTKDLCFEFGCREELPRALDCREIRVKINGRGGNPQLVLQCADNRYQFVNLAVSEFASIPVSNQADPDRMAVVLVGIRLREAGLPDFVGAFEW